MIFNLIFFEFIKFFINFVEFQPFFLEKVRNKRKRSSFLFNFVSKFREYLSFDEAKSESLLQMHLGTRQRWFLSLAIRRARRRQSRLDEIFVQSVVLRRQFETDKAAKKQQ